MNIVHTLLSRWANLSLRFENARLTFGLDVAHMEIKRLERSRQHLIDRAYRQDEAMTVLEVKVAEKDAEIAALKWELERRDDNAQDAAINRRNEAAEDYYADLDRDRGSEWI